MADAVIIAMQDQMHYEPAMKAIELGYHVLLEKPMAPTPAQCLAIGKAAEEARHTGTVVDVTVYEQGLL